MLNPYFLMSLLYLSLALLIAFGNVLGLFDLIPAIAGIRWLRVHFITLGTLTEAAFWLAPALVAMRNRQEPSPTRWGTWLSLNGGLLALIVGAPLMNDALMLAGGTLVFLAVLLLIRQLATSGQSLSSISGRPFYIAGLAYLLLGIIVGTGLWQGWGTALHIKVPVEVHIHANSWGFMSLLFAGLLVDFYSDFSGQELAWPRSIQPLFWLMTLGALGLVVGPWIGSNWFLIPGLVMHMGASLLLLANVVRPLAGEQWSAGMWHLITSYFWFFAPVLAAPLIIAGVAGFPGAGIERNAPQALVYGWMLQFGFAFLPYFFSRALYPEREAVLGGTWFSLIAAHLAGLIFWISIFVGAYRDPLQGIAYTLWIVALLPILWQLWTLLQGEKVEDAPTGATAQLGELRAGESRTGD